MFLIRELQFFIILTGTILVEYSNLNRASHKKHTQYRHSSTEERESKALYLYLEKLLFSVSLKAENGI